MSRVHVQMTKKITILKFLIPGFKTKLSLLVAAVYHNHCGSFTAAICSCIRLRNYTLNVNDSYQETFEQRNERFGLYEWSCASLISKTLGVDISR